MAVEPSREAVLGPFTGGMNTYSQKGAIADNELVKSMNFIPDVDGSLKCRPPLVTIQNNPVQFNNHSVDAVGAGILSGVNLTFFSNSNGVYSWDGTVMNTIGSFATNTAGSALCSFQYRNQMYFPSADDNTRNGGKWDPANGWTSFGAGGMPGGIAATIYKERAWIADRSTHTLGNNSRVWFSNIQDADTWDPANYFQITQGDGQRLTDIRVFNNNLLIFKESSTYYLSYDSKPADATIVKISNNIGASDWSCVAEHDNDIFVMHKDSVYQLVNFNWVQINTKVPFVLDTSVPPGFARIRYTTLSVVDDWLICRYHNNTYVYNINTQTWGQWESIFPDLQDFGPFVRFPSTGTFDVNNNWVAGTSIDGFTNVIRIKNGYEAGVIEYNGFDGFINCYVITKSYNFNIPWRFKRLFSWAVDCVTNQSVTGTATPLSENNPPSVGTTIGASAPQPLRRVYRFKKGLRFREIQFRVDTVCDGSPSEGPAQIYIILALVKAAELVPKGIN